MMRVTPASATSCSRSMQCGIGPAIVDWRARYCVRPSSSTRSALCAAVSGEAWWRGVVTLLELLHLRDQLVRQSLAVDGEPEDVVGGARQHRSDLRDALGFGRGRHDVGHAPDLQVVHRAAGCRQRPLGYDRDFAPSLRRSGCWKARRRRRFALPAQGFSAPRRPSRPACGDGPSAAAEPRLDTSPARRRTSPARR